MKTNNDNCSTPVNNLIYESTSCFDAMGRDVKNATNLGTTGVGVFAGKFNDMIGLFNFDVGDSSLTVSSNLTNKTIEYAVAISAAPGNGLSLNLDGLFASSSGGSGITDLTGDVTATGPGSVAATIANNAVTYAKMQDVSATDRLLGRVSAGAGDVEEVVLDPDGTLAANSDDIVSTQKAVKTYIDSFKVKFSKSTVDQTTASLVLIDITNLTLPISSSQTIYFRAALHMGTSANNGARYAITIPAGATMKVMLTAQTTTAIAAGTGANATQWLTVSGTTSLSLNGVTQANQNAVFEGWVTTSGTSGNIQIQARTMDAGNTLTFYAGSFITGHTI